MNTQVMDEIFERYCDAVYRLAYSYLKNAADAEDVVQDVFVKRMQCSKKFRDEEHEKAWLLRVTINRAKDLLKSHWMTKRDVEEKIYLGYSLNLDQEKKEVLEQVLALPEKCKVAVYLHYFEGYTSKEIGKILHCTEAAVRMRLKKGRELLKMELEDLRGTG